MPPTFYIEHGTGKRVEAGGIFDATKQYTQSGTGATRSGTELRTPTQIANQGRSGYDVFGKPAVEPTIVSDATFREETIPSLNRRLTSLDSPTYQGMDGTQYYSDQYDESGRTPLDATPNGMGQWELGGTTYGAAPQFYEDPKQNALMAAMMQHVDAQTRQLIQSIQQQSAVRKAQQEEINKRAEAGTEQALLMAGTARYAPLGADALAQKRASFGLQQIAALDAEEQSLIAQAKAAQQTQNFKLMGEALTAAEEKRKEKQEEARRLAEAQAAENNILRQRQQQSMLDSAVGELVAGGVNDIASIQSALRDAGYPATAEEIANSLQYYTTTGNASDLESDYGMFTYFKNNGTLPSVIAAMPENEQYFAWLNMMKLAETGKLAEAAARYEGTGSAGYTTGVGAKNSAEETIIRSRLFSKLMNILNKGQVSDSDRAIIDERIALLRSAGYSEQTILDELSGFATDVKTPYNNTFRDLIVANTKDLNMQNDQMGKVSILLNSGNYDAALRTVENLAFERAKDIVGTGETGTYMSTGTAEVYLSRLNRIREIAKQMDYNLISGTFAGLQWRVQSRGAAALKAELTNLYATFRKENLGSAVTPSEAVFLAPLFANLAERSGNFAEKLNAFERGLLDRHNGTRRAVSLPSVSAQHVLDDERRLQLYESVDSINPFEESLNQ